MLCHALTGYTDTGTVAAIHPILHTAAPKVNSEFEMTFAAEAI